MSIPRTVRSPERGSVSRASCLLFPPRALLGQRTGAYRLYLPKPWAEDAQRRKKAGVPAEVKFATKTQIALEQLRPCWSKGAQVLVLADAAYGVDQAFRQRLADLGLPYVVGITSSWSFGLRAWSLCAQAIQRKGAHPRCHAAIDLANPVGQALAQAWRPVRFRPSAGARAPMNPQRALAAVRVRHAGGNIGKARLHEQGCFARTA